MLVELVPDREQAPGQLKAGLAERVLFGEAVGVAGEVAFDTERRAV